MKSFLVFSKKKAPISLDFHLPFLLIETLIYNSLCGDICNDVFSKNSPKIGLLMDGAGD